MPKGAWSAMTFQQLEYIVEISKCGSINKAAQKLFLSQSGISTAVRELESELGIALLARSNRGVEFTPEGKEFLSYAVSLLEQKRWIEGLYGEPGTARHPFGSWCPASGIPLWRTLFCGCSRSRMRTASAWDCGRRGWTASSTRSMTTGRISSSSA